MQKKLKVTKKTLTVLEMNFKAKKKAIDNYI